MRGAVAQKESLAIDQVVCTVDRFQQGLARCSTDMFAQGKRPQESREQVAQRESLAVDQIVSTVDRFLQVLARSSTDMFAQGKQREFCAINRIVCTVACMTFALRRVQHWVSAKRVRPLGPASGHGPLQTFLRRLEDHAHGARHPAGLGQLLGVALSGPAEGRTFRQQPLHGPADVLTVPEPGAAFSWFRWKGNRTTSIWFRPLGKKKKCFPVVVGSL